MSANKDYSGVAKLWFKIEQYESAALNFGKALKSDPHNVNFILNRFIPRQSYYRSTCFEKLGRYRDAINELKKGKAIKDSLGLGDFSFDKKIAQVHIHILMQIYFKN